MIIGGFRVRDEDAEGGEDGGRPVMSRVEGEVGRVRGVHVYKWNDEQRISYGRSQDVCSCQKDLNLSRGSSLKVETKTCRGARSSSATRHPGNTKEAIRNGFQSSMAGTQNASS